MCYKTLPNIFLLTFYLIFLKLWENENNMVTTFHFFAAIQLCFLCLVLCYTVCPE